MFLVGFAESMVTLLKGLKHVGFSLSFEESILYSIIIGIGIALLGSLILRNVDK